MTGPDPFASAVDRHRSARVDWSDLWTAEHDADDWLIAPIIARGRGHALYAPSKAGKSLFLLYLVASAAAGRRVLDHQGGEPVRVLYLDMEMTREDVRERLLDMGFGPCDDLSALSYYSLPSIPVLDSQMGGEEVLELALHHRAELVIFDTMSRVIGGEENSADTLRNYFRWTGARLKAEGIATLRIDHAGKDLERGQRGTSAKADDVDLVWQMVPRDRDRLDLKATHRRMGWAPQVVHLEQRPDPLSYYVAGDSWPAGTAQVAATLDRLGVPPEAGKAKAAAALRDAGEGARNETVLAAQRYRRMQVGTGTEGTKAGPRDQSRPNRSPSVPGPVIPLDTESRPDLRKPPVPNPTGTTGDQAPSHRSPVPPSLEGDQDQTSPHGP